MAKVPIEIVIMGGVHENEVSAAIEKANSIQTEFEFQRLYPASERKFRTLHFRTINTDNFFPKAAAIKNSLTGFHPHLVLFVDSDLEGGGWRNLFSSRDPDTGIAISTSKGVPIVIIPRAKMVSYYLYYLGRHSLKFIAPNHYNHHDTRTCVYDFMKNKRDILLSMKSGALCDECRGALSKDSRLSAEQLEALDKIFHESGRLLKNNNSDTSSKTKVFIGSSLEGLNIAREIKRQLERNFDVDVWEKDTVFGLGQVTIEALEAAVNKYDIGIFVFTPDDKLFSRGDTKPVARDNVIFESGLFIGKLSRFKAFIVQPSRNRIVLPSDLKGLTTATFDSSKKRLSTMLRPTVKKIKDTIEKKVT